MSQSPVPKDASETVQLSKRGDVLLNVGKENQPAVRLLVSSALLSQASPVFEVMFNGRFAEGQDLSSDAPREISLPDDDPESMKILAKVIHFSAEDVDGTLSLDSLADFAVLCDKYKCTRAVISWSRLWAGQFLANPNMPGLEKLLFVTYALDIPEEFRQATKVLLQNQATAINLDIAQHGLDFVPSKFLEAMQEAWNQIQDDTIRALQPDHVLTLLNNGGHCARAKNISWSWFQKLAAARLTPIRSVSLAELRIRVRDFLSSPLSDLGDMCTSYRCPCKDAKKIQDKVSTDIQRIMDSVEGFCLDCVVKEATRNHEQVCRISHE